MGLRLREEVGCNDHLTAWKWPFLLARELLAYGGTPDDHLVAIQAFVDAAEAEYDDVYYGVVDCWDKVLVPAGADALSVAVREAKQDVPRTPGDHTRLYDIVELTAHYLSLHTHPEPFFLPRKALAKLLGCAPITVTRVINLLVKKGSLLEIDSRWSYSEGKAKTYQVVPPRPPKLERPPAGEPPAPSGA